ncbi:DNRLRE domain-containing protein [Streptomyces sp. CAU 1734]|uniref:DNRLRE domain-containing protein n=1 Tax=Streptomyces sp. CAU 1734 TaxID=3140360 RepID=UPI003261D050
MTVERPAPHERGRQWSKASLRHISCGLALTLAVTLLDGAAGAAEASAAPRAAKKQAVTQAADIASARVAARLSGKRVEALSERTETSTTWVNKDGSLTTELAAGPVRFKDDATRSWRDVELDLVRSGDGGVEPKAHPEGLRLAGKSGVPAASIQAARTARATDLVTLGEGDRAITLQWRGGLPAPKLTGTRAEYPNAVPGADVVVEATRTGFEQFVEINRRPADADYSYTLPLRAKGLTFKQLKDGSLLFTDRAKNKHAVMPAPVMWDASTDKVSGEHTRRARVAMKAVPTRNGADLVITPDAKFLADPRTKYPVTVDPSTSALGNVFDSYVQQGETVDWSADTELDLGNPGTTNPNGTPRTARSFISWDTAPVQDALITDAKLSLWNFHSGNTTCAAQPWEVWSTGYANTATRWTSQPGWTAKKATSTETKGNPGCAGAPDGWINADVTGLVQEWASAKAARGHMGLRATSETATAQWKRVNSSNAAANPPKLTVTYNYRPRTGTKQEAGPPYFSYGGDYLVNTLTPTLRDTFVDANGDKVNGTFQIFDDAANTQVGSPFVSPYAPSGQPVSATVPAGWLTNGKKYRFRTNPYDGAHYNTGWSAWKTFTVDTSAPSAPTAITSADYPTGQWVRGAGQAGTFTVTPPAGDHNWLEWSLDGVTWTKHATGGTAGAKDLSVAPPKDGTHTLQVRAVDKADNKSEAVSHTFHAGPGGFIEPGEGERTARRLPLVAEAEAGKYDAVSFSWRRSAADPWVRIPAGDVTSGGSPVGAWPVPLVNGRNAALVWNASDTVNPDGTVQLKADFTGPAGAAGATEPLTVVVDRNASGAASESIGPGSVNLLTGDHILSSSDAAAFDLGISRTASSRVPDKGARQQGQAAIFGKEWVAGTAAEDEQETTYSHVRRVSDTAVDVVLSEGDSLHFTANAGRNGWIPEPGTEDLTLRGSTSGSFTLADTDGTVTEFTKPDPAAATWQVSSTLLDGLNNTETTVVSETVTVDGRKLARPRRVIAPTSAATAAACAADPSVKGCRLVEYVYATATTATASGLGDVTGQVKEVKLWATEPGAAASTAVAVQSYAYDGAGRLREVWNPRITPALKTAYEYDGAGRVTRLTPPGELPWSFTYGTGAREGMLLRTERSGLQQGTTGTQQGTAATSVVYDVPLTGGSAPYPMGANDVRAWGQLDAPVDATALFPADSVPSAHSGSGLTAADYRRAGVHYLGVSGREVNSASPGGHITTTEYDRFGNTVRELTAGNRAIALGLTAGDRAVRASLGVAGLSGAERAELLSSRSVFNATGTREVEEFGPLHRIDLTADLTSGGTVLLPSGTSAMARSWTVKEYDAGRPTDGTAKSRDQVTRVVTGAQVREHPSVHGETRVSQTVYDWPKGLATKSIQDPGGLALVTETQYDAQGRLVRQLLPGASGTDAATRVTSYWTAGGTGACSGRPEWADLVCSTGPAGAITGGGSQPSQLPTSTTEYDRWGNSAKVTETANGVTRTTTSSYDAAGRLTTTAITGGTGQALPQSAIEYDPETGRALRTVSPTGGTITSAFDRLGRQISYTDADGGRTSTEYDLLNRPVKVSDTSPATVQYSYDHTAEPRGLATRNTHSVAGAFEASYDADGGVAEEKLPGGYTLRAAEDTTGSATGRTYTRDSDGTTVYSDAVTESIHGQVTTHAGWSDQSYGYDAAGRLKTVADTADTVCTLRTYAFDARTNRTGLTSATGTPGGNCPTAGGTSTTHTYDSGDRLVDAGYTYDAFGRTTALPGHGTIGYYANDLVHQQTANGQRQTWQLDANLRHRSWVKETGSGSTWARTASKRNHYDSDGDAPRWIVEDTASGALTRNVESISGDLAATTGTTAGTVLQLTTIHGGVALQLPLDVSQAPVALDHDEYGNPRAGRIAARYGWLGGKQRSAETATGLTLMGVRLYNPGTGRFLSPDPAYGGNANAYEYVNGDPLNRYDLDGKWGWAKKKWKSFKNSSVGRHIKRNRKIYGWAAGIGIGIIGGACVAATAGICAGAGGLLIGAAFGAGGGAASYRIGYARRSWSGYRSRMIYGAATVVGPGVFTRWRTIGNPQTARNWSQGFRRESSYVRDRRRKVHQHWGFGTRWIR